jgi:hypothetical protein
VRAAAIAHVALLWHTRASGAIDEVLVGAAGLSEEAEAALMPDLLSGTPCRSRFAGLSFVDLAAVWPAFFGAIARGWACRQRGMVTN